MATENSTPSPEPDAVVLMLDASAEENLSYFAAIVSAVWAGPEAGSGRAYVDALAEAGFDKSAMQVTRDESTVGNAAESIQFSVLWAGECLIGQVGPSTGEPVAVVMPALGGGMCLLGDTRTIDW